MYRYICMNVHLFCIIIVVWILNSCERKYFFSLIYFQLSLRTSFSFCTIYYSSIDMETDLLLTLFQTMNTEITGKKALVSLQRYRTLCNRSNTRKSVSSGYPNPEKCVEKRGRRPSFLTTSRCLDILMKHSSQCLIQHLKQISI